TERVNKYETTLSIRLDIEAALTYSLLGFSGLLFLVFETKNDYVRFHAWQSSITFFLLMLVQFLFSFVSSGMVWFLFFVEIGLAAFLAFNAYKNADGLARYMLPWIGPV
ncbi:hypothetical protein EDD86DRAFT_182296, partial [Gorgonomyces haynaldii]